MRTPLRQWTLKITKYADQLEAGLKGLDWPEGTLTAQKQWIGRSEGARWGWGMSGGDVIVTTFPVSGRSSSGKGPSSVVWEQTVRWGS